MTKAIPAGSWHVVMDSVILKSVDVQFDLIYSFLSIGYHWSIHLYLEQLQAHCHENTLLIFGMRGTDRGGDFAAKQVAAINPANIHVVA